MSLSASSRVARNYFWKCSCIYGSRVYAVFLNEWVKFFVLGNFVGNGAFFSKRRKRDFYNKWSFEGLIGFFSKVERYFFYWVVAIVTPTSRKYEVNGNPQKLSGWSKFCGIRFIIWSSWQRMADSSRKMRFVLNISLWSPRGPIKE